MKIFGYGTGLKPWKGEMSPYPTSLFGLTAQLRGGDVAEPIGFGTNWFSPPYPKRVLRFYCLIPVLPFFSIRLGNFGFYFGFKAYGVDCEAYKDWLCDPKEVYSGSQAMCFTARFTTALR